MDEGNYNMQYIINLIAENIGIRYEDIISGLEQTILRQIDTFQVPRELEEKIKELIKQDNEINQFGKEHNIKSDNFNELKINLGKLQLLAILKKANNCEDVLNSFIDLLNNKIGAINDILKAKLQAGGSDINYEYYRKYNKYKNKYLLFKNSIH
jgi:hypothetical protein